MSHENEDSIAAMIDLCSSDDDNMKSADDETNVRGTGDCGSDRKKRKTKHSRRHKSKKQTTTRFKTRRSEEWVDIHVYRL